MIDLLKKRVYQLHGGSLAAFIRCTNTLGWIWASKITVGHFLAFNLYICICRLYHEHVMAISSCIRRPFDQMNDMATFIGTPQRLQDFDLLVYLHNNNETGLGPRIRNSRI